MATAQILRKLLHPKRNGIIQRTRWGETGISFYETMVRVVTGIFAILLRSFQRVCSDAEGNYKKHESNTKE